MTVPIQEEKLLCSIEEKAERYAQSIYDKNTVKSDSKPFQRAYKRRIERDYKAGYQQCLEDIKEGVVIYIPKGEEGTEKWNY